MVRGIIIPAIDSKPPARQDLVDLEDYQHAVGGWIEVIDLAALTAALFINEEGLIRRLPFNRRATFLWWFHEPGARGRARLVGDVVIVGSPDVNGDSSDLPEAVAALLLTRATYNVATREPSDSRWHPSPDDHDDYFEAIVWATLLAEHAPGLHVVVRPIDSIEH